MNFKTATDRMIHALELVDLSAELMTLSNDLEG
jgi:hypothetical protein